MMLRSMICTPYLAVLPLVFGLHCFGPPLDSCMSSSHSATVRLLIYSRSQFVYAEEPDKGAYIAWQLFLLSGSSAVGSLVAFSINVNDISTGGVPASVYIAYICIMCTAIVLE